MMVIFKAKDAGYGEAGPSKGLFKRGRIAEGRYGQHRLCHKVSRHGLFRVKALIPI